MYLPKLYSSLQLAKSIISCCWYRLPRQIPIRCYLIEVLSLTNKSNRKLYFNRQRQQHRVKKRLYKVRLILT